MVKKFSQSTNKFNSQWRYLHTQTKNRLHTFLSSSFALTLSTDVPSTVPSSMLAWYLPWSHFGSWKFLLTRTRTTATSQRGGEPLSQACTRTYIQKEIQIHRSYKMKLVTRLQI